MSSQVKNRSEESLNNRSNSVVSALNGELTNLTYREGGLYLRTLGEIKTIIDAAIPAGPQNKSTKDLISQAYMRGLDRDAHNRAQLLRSFARLVGDTNHTWPGEGDKKFAWPTFTAGSSVNPTKQSR